MMGQHSATNPASFDVTLYSNSRTNCIVLQNINSHHFDEKNGINCVQLKEPLETTNAQSQSVDSTIEQSMDTLSGSGGPNHKIEKDKSLDTQDPRMENDGLYEDGEIQDVDYEEISSNEELFSDADEDAAMVEDTHQVLDQLIESDPRFARCCWRFNPWSIGNDSAALSGSAKRFRIPDPTWTLFQIHCWLLERSEETTLLTRESSTSQANTEAVENDPLVNSDSAQVMDITTTTPSESQPQPTHLSPPPSDESTGKASAEYLLHVTDTFSCAGYLNVTWNESWVEAMEKLESHLSPGLAYLHHTDKAAFQTVTDSLIVWIYAGLDLSIALRQPNNTFIIRHLLAGIKLCGLVTGTLCPRLARLLLYPSKASLKQSSPTCSIDGLQVQHLLLNLLESPLVITPLRLAIYHALDQTTRLPVGLDAFLGRECIAPQSSDNATPLIDVETSNGDGEITMKQSDSPCAIKQEEEERVPTDDDVKLEHVPKVDPSIDEGELKETVSMKATDEIQSSENSVLQTPYQRFVFLVSSCKNTRLTVAYQRLLNKVHAYEFLLDFHQLTDRFLTTASPVIELEQEMTYALTQIASLIETAPEIIANPKTTFPTPMLVSEDKRMTNNPFPGLCSMLDATHLLDDVIRLVLWIREDDQCSIPDDIQNATDENPNSIDDTVAQSSKNDNQDDQRVSVWRTVCRLFQVLLSNAQTLTLIASRPDTSCELLKALLHVCTIPTARLHSSSCLDHMLIGLELVYKLEAIHHLDGIVNWTRLKGTLAALSKLSGDEPPNEKTEDKGALETASVTMLRDALFGLARLSASVGSATVRLATHLDSATSETVRAVLNGSAPVWVAEVIGMDDHFAPFLLLLEAFASSETDGVESSRMSKGKTSETDLTAPTNAADAAPASGMRTTLRQILSSPLNLMSLTTTIVLNVLRHTENAAYLNLYGPRLAQLTSSHLWDDYLSETAAFHQFTTAQTFAQAASPWLSWLRDSPARLGVINLATICDPTSSASEAFAWLIGQLKPLATELEDALDSLLGLETADEMLQAATNVTPLGIRRSSSSQLLAVTGRCITPGLVLLLRMLRSHVSSSPSWGQLEQWTSLPERQVVISRNLALIELYSANGLEKLTSIIQKLTDFFLLQCQVSAGQSTCPPTTELVAISTLNSNVSLLLSMLDAAVHSISQLLTTVLRMQRSEFRDFTPIRALCQAFACASYTISPAGPKRDQVERIQKAVITALLAYANADVGVSLSIKELGNSLWVCFCREVINFTVSNPVYFIPGVKLLLELLPLPLPVYTKGPLESTIRQQIQSARDRWAVRVLSLAPEFTGLVELLGATDPTMDNSLWTHLRELIHRLVDLGLPCATFLTTACLDSLYAVWNELQEEVVKKSKTSTRNDTPAAESDGADNVTSLNRHAENTSTTGTVLKDLTQVSILPRTPSARLLMNMATGQHTTAQMDNSGGLSASVTTATGTDATGEPTLLTHLADSNELSSALSVLLAHLQVPVSRLVLLHLLRQGPPKSIKSTDDASGKPEEQVETTSRAHQFISIARNILSPCSEKPCHMRTQLLLLKCITLLLHTDMAIYSLAESPDTQQPPDNPMQRLADGLPDQQLTEGLITVLVEHVNNPDRDMTTLPSALLPLLLLTRHDHGFAMVRDILDSPSTAVHGQHFFANMVQRVNDCFSAENPDCQATLTNCLRLLQSLVVASPNLPLTFMRPSAEQLDGGSSTRMVWQSRRMHLSGNRVRTLLGWSTGGDEGKPVRDLHALLEMLADDEPSLEYLRSGMKNLLALLSEEFDIPECPISVVDNLPKPRAIEELFAGRVHFVSLNELATDSMENVRRKLLVARRRLSSCADGIGVETSKGMDVILDSKPASITFNLAELAFTCCNGMVIRDELIKCGRQCDSAEAAIRHQKRRRGHSSIIDTGRSTKKFVAPMRGRGFVLRNSSGAPSAGGIGPGNNSGPGSQGGSSNSAGNSGGGGGSLCNRPDLFRSRPLNTSRPPSLHVDDFTKLVKDDNTPEATSRSRPHRDNRNFRGRGPRGGLGRGNSNAMSSASATMQYPGLQFGMPAPGLNPLTVTSLLPTWTTPARSLPILPFNLDTRNLPPGRRDRNMR